MRTFDYHRGIAPLLWAFVALATTELLVVHLLLSLRWPIVAWPLSIVTAASVLWTIIWVQSMRRRPHQLDGETLRLHVGSLRSIEVPVRSIERVRSSWNSGEHKGAGVSNLALIAYPNRVLDLGEPIIGRCGEIRRVALRLDNPLEFDDAMRSMGVSVA